MPASLRAAVAQSASSGGPSASADGRAITPSTAARRDASARVRDTERPRLEGVRHHVLNSSKPRSGIGPRITRRLRALRLLLIGSGGSRRVVRGGMRAGRIVGTRNSKFSPPSWFLPAESLIGGQRIKPRTIAGGERPTTRRFRPLLSHRHLAAEAWPF